MNLQMYLLYNPLRTRPIKTGREKSMEPYPNRQFGSTDDPDRQSGCGSVPTHTRTGSASPDPLLTLVLECSLSCRDAVVKHHNKCTHFCKGDNKHLTSSSYFLSQYHKSSLGLLLCHAIQFVLAMMILLAPYV